MAATSYENETVVISNAEKACVLNKQFCSVLTREDFRIPKLTSPLSPEMANINIDMKGVKQLIKNLDPFKADGSDRLQTQFLKLMAEELSAGMTLILTASLQQVEIPNVCGDALVSPLYKLGKTKRSNPENYRPILFTSVYCTLLKHITQSNSIEHLDHNNITADTQHGFQ